MGDSRKELIDRWKSVWSLARAAVGGKDILMRQVRKDRTSKKPNPAGEHWQRSGRCATLTVVTTVKVLPSAPTPGPSRSPQKLTMLLLKGRGQGGMQPWSWPVEANHVVQQMVNAMVMIYLPRHVWGLPALSMENQKLMPLPYRSSTLSVLPHSSHILFKSREAQDPAALHCDELYLITASERSGMLCYAAEQPQAWIN